AHEQRGLARAGAGHQVEREDAARSQPGAVFRGAGVVLAEDVALDPDHLRLGQSRSMGVRRSGAEVQLVVAVGDVDVRRGGDGPGPRRCVLAIARPPRTGGAGPRPCAACRAAAAERTDPGFTCSATAYRTHLSFLLARPDPGGRVHAVFNPLPAP